MAGSFVAGVKAALPRLNSSNPAERAAGCASVASLLLNGNGRDLPMMEIVLPALLKIAGVDPVAMVPLATGAQGLWATLAYPEALMCLDVTMRYAPPGEAALSKHRRPWDDWSIPYTRDRELALNRLWRFESLLAVGRVDEALAIEREAIAGSGVLPVPFRLSASLYEWGDAAAFAVRARIRATRALRRRSNGGDANAFRKIRKGHLPKPSEAAHLRASAKNLIDQALCSLDARLVDFAAFPSDQPPALAIGEQRALAGWRAEGYAEGGLVARDLGDSVRASRLLATAHWLFALFDPGLRFIGSEYRDAIAALAPEPRLNAAATT